MVKVMYLHPANLLPISVTGGDRKGIRLKLLMYASEKSYIHTLQLEFDSAALTR